MMAASTPVRVALVYELDLPKDSTRKSGNGRKIAVVLLKNADAIVRAASIPMLQVNPRPIIRTIRYSASAESIVTSASLLTFMPRKENCGKKPTSAATKSPVARFPEASVPDKMQNQTVSTEIKAVASRALLI